MIIDVIVRNPDDRKCFRYLPDAKNTQEIFFYGTPGLCVVGGGGSGRWSDVRDDIKKKQRQNQVTCVITRSFTGLIGVFRFEIDLNRDFS